MRRAAAVALMLLVSGCLPVNYMSPDGPRHTAPTIVPAPGAAGSLRVVTFNVKHSRQIDSALALLTSDPAVMGVDVLLLQEMDSAGSARMAAALGMGFVYYPATRYRTGRDMGNAVLTRWPIEDDAKIILPHKGRLGRTSRIATAATLRIGPERIRVYSVHLGTWAEVTAGGRRAQIGTVLADADRYQRVIIGGDLNSLGLGREVLRRDYQWPTERGPRTTALGRWDHVFFRGFTLPDSSAAGTVMHRRGASDHRPVWAVAVLSP